MTVATVLNHLAAGDSVDDVLVRYPALERDDVEAALEFFESVLSGPEGNSRPAAVLGISRRSLIELLKRRGIPRPRRNSSLSE